MIWYDIREEEFEGAIKRSGGLCIIPLGCTEKHGQHLPVGTDYYETMAIVKRATELEDAVILPPGAWLGEVSCYHSVKDPKAARIRGSIGIKQSTILTVLEELCDEAWRNGFNKILIVNGHGGNTHLIKHFLRCQSYGAKNYATLSTFAIPMKKFEPQRLICTLTERKADFPYITQSDIDVLKGYANGGGYGGGHADFRETSLIMAYDKGLVAEDRFDAESGESRHRTDYLKRLGIEAANEWIADYPNAFEGKAPFGASERLGRAMTELAAEELARKIKLLKEDTEILRIARALPGEN